MLDAVPISASVHAFARFGRHGLSEVGLGRGWDE